MSKDTHGATDSSTDSLNDINRRAVLKGVGASSAAYALGASNFTGAAAAGSDGDFSLYILTPSTQVYEGEAVDLDSYEKPDGTEVSISDKSEYQDAFANWGIKNQTLVEIDGLPGADVGNVLNVTTLDPQFDTSGSDVNNVIQTATLAYRPGEDMLYGIANQNYDPTGLLDPGDGRGPGRYLFKVDPNNGEVTLVGEPNDDLRYLWGSTFDADGSSFYALESDFNPDNVSETLYSVDPSTGDTSEIGIVDDELVDDVTHVGLSYNPLNPTFSLVGVLGNFEGQKDDLVEIDPTNATSQVTADEIFDTGELVSTAFNPCVGGDPKSQRVYTFRNGNELFTADVLADGAAERSATLTIDSGTEPVPLINVDNVAEDPVICGDIACPRTIGYWKNHPGCDNGKGKGNGKGKSNKTTIETVLDGTDGCGGFIVGDDVVYDGMGTVEGDYDFSGDDDPCSADEESEEKSDVDLIVDAIENASAKDMDDQLLAQLLATKLNICNFATTSGTGIEDVVAYVDRYFSAVTDPSEDGQGETTSEVIDAYIDEFSLAEDVSDRYVKEMWKDSLDDYNNDNSFPSCE